MVETPEEYLSWVHLAWPFFSALRQYYIVWLMSLIPSASNSYFPWTTHSHIEYEFPSIFHAQSEVLEPKHRVTLHILTNGQPDFAKARHSPLDKLKAVKKEFQHTVSVGIARSSNSPLLSSLHMVAKKNNDWRLSCAQPNHSPRPISKSSHSVFLCNLTTKDSFPSWILSKLIINCEDDCNHILAFVGVTEDALWSS